MVHPFVYHFFLLLSISKEYFSFHTRLPLQQILCNFLNGIYFNVPKIEVLLLFEYTDGHMELDLVW